MNQNREIQLTFFFLNLELIKKFGFAFWIGLNTLNFNSGWQWARGSPFRYLNWVAGKDCIYFVIFEWFLIPTNENCPSYFYFRKAHSNLQ